MNEGQLSSLQVRKFALAGAAIFTVSNETTGNRFTFKVSQPKDDAPHFVSVLTGSDNVGDYTYLGTIFDSDRFVHGKKSTIGRDAQSAKVFAWFWHKTGAGRELPACVAVHHLGRCGRCGRALTVPESVESGFGPKCRTM